MKFKFEIPLTIGLYIDTSDNNGPVTQDTIEQCIRIASKALDGKRDLDGNAAILHSLTVGMMGITDTEKCVGFLHDVIEDGDMSLNELHFENIPEEILEAVDLCTNDCSLSYDEYIQRIIDSGNTAAINVKLNDLRHNLARAKAGSHLDLVEKYESALAKIEKSLPER